MTAQWVMRVAVPLALNDDLRDRLFDAVADAVAAWEPEGRDGWDADLTAGRDLGIDAHSPAYVHVSGAAVARTEEVAEYVNVDYAADGSVVGVEVIEATGVEADAVRAWGQQRAAVAVPDPDARPDDLEALRRRAEGA